MNIFKGVEGKIGKKDMSNPFQAIIKKRLNSKPMLRALPFAALLALLAVAPLKAFCSEPDTTKKNLPPELFGKGVKIEELAKPGTASGSPLQTPINPQDSLLVRSMLGQLFEQMANGKDCTSAPIASVFASSDLDGMRLSPVPSSAKLKVEPQGQKLDISEELKALGLKKFSRHGFKILPAGTDAEGRQDFFITNEKMGGVLLVTVQETLKQNSDGTLEGGFMVDVIPCPIEGIASSGELPFAVKTDTRGLPSGPTIAFLDGENLFILESAGDFILRRYTLNPMVSVEGKAPPAETKLVFFGAGEEEYILIKYPDSGRYHIFGLTGEYYINF